MPMPEDLGSALEALYIERDAIKERIDQLLRLKREREAEDRLIAMAAFSPHEGSASEGQTTDNYSPVSLAHAECSCGWSFSQKGLARADAQEKLATHFELVSSTRLKYGLS